MKNRKRSLTATLALLGFVVVAAPSFGQCDWDKIVPGDGSSADWFGWSVSLSDDRVLVGAHLDDDAGAESGSAYVYVLDDQGTPDPSDDQWIQEAKLTPSDGAAQDLFGRAVSLSENLALVGAYYNDEAATDAGAAYVFRREDNGTPEEENDDYWVEESKLMALDTEEGDWFGYSVAIDGDRALVGAPFDDDAGPTSGSAYLFRRINDNHWIQEDKLVAADGSATDWFGTSVSLSDDRALVGAKNDDDAGSNSGSVYVYRRADAGTPNNPSDDYWVEEDKLLAADGAPNDQFGLTVSLNGDQALVGSPFDDDAGSASGSAYLFCRDDQNTPLDPNDDIWVQLDKLVPQDTAAGDQFGCSVSIEGGNILVGAYKADDAGSASGSAYLFRRDDQGTPLDPNDDDCVEMRELVAPDGAAGDQFGHSVVLSGHRAVVGAYFDTDWRGRSGAAYLYAIEAKLSFVEYDWADPSPGYAFFNNTMLAQVEARIENQSLCSVYNVTAYLTDVPSHLRLGSECSSYAAPGWPECDAEVVFVGSLLPGQSLWSTPDTFIYQADLTAAGDPCEVPMWTVEYDDEDGVRHVLYPVPALQVSDGTPGCSGDYFGLGQPAPPSLKHSLTIGRQIRPTQSVRH